MLPRALEKEGGGIGEKARARVRRSQKFYLKLSDYKRKHIYDEIYTAKHGSNVREVGKRAAEKPTNPLKVERLPLPLETGRLLKPGPKSRGRRGEHVWSQPTKEIKKRE